MSTTGRLLVTGAAGQLGRLVVAELAAAGWRVVAVDRRIPAALPDGVRPVVADIRRPDDLRQAMAGCEAVIHLAAHTNPGAGSGADVFAGNTAATFAVLAAAAEAGVRTAVLASSVSAYGMSYAPQLLPPRYVPVDEDHPLLPQDAYGLSKQADEHTGAMFTRRHAMSVVALRLHWVATAAQIHDRVAATAADPGFGAGPRELWGYVECRDAARAFRAALEVREGCHTVQVCAPDTLSPEPTRTLLERFHPGTAVRAALPGGTGLWSTDRARRLLGCAPAWTWREHQPQHPEAIHR
ncbi:MAG: NAD-dependent epimerase/dehydratase family protein [Micromonosporaceae bacterium]|nr:NAD-dependent epimerase/dehydratase family protein [Micromonosporaceae bacterium]